MLAVVARERDSDASEYDVGRCIEGKLLRDSSVVVVLLEDTKGMTLGLIHFVVSL